MGLYHRIPRELLGNLPRYLALLLLIALSMYVVVGIMGAAEGIIYAVKEGAERNLREDGQFTVFVPLSQAQLEALGRDGVTVEPIFYLDFALEGGTILRVFSARERINLAEADEGAPPAASGELLLEKLFAGAHDIHVGDILRIGGGSFTVSGIGSSPDYDSPLRSIADVATDKNHFGTAFVTTEAYGALKVGGCSIQSEEYVYAYRLNGAMTHEALKARLKALPANRDAITDRLFLELLNELQAPGEELLGSVAGLVEGGTALKQALGELSGSGAELMVSLRRLGLSSEQRTALLAHGVGIQAAANGAGELAQGLEELRSGAEALADEMLGYELKNLISFLKAENNPRIAASAADVAINKSGGALAGGLALALFAYVISVFIVHGIDKDGEVIGTLYAMGVPRGALMRHYLALPVLIAALGGIAGTALGFSPLGVAYQMRDAAGYFSYPAPAPYYPAYLLVYGLLLPPVIAATVNWLVIRGRLARPPLQLLRGEHGRIKTSRLRLSGLSFIGVFRVRQILREKRASMAVCGGMFIALLLLTVGLNCYAFIDTMRRENAEDLRFTYMISLKYPPKEAPEGAAACYVKGLSREIHGYELEISVLGIEAENPYFDFAPAAGRESLTISSSMANKYHLKAGDDVILTDTAEDRRYVFTVERVVPYSVGLYAFMELSSMRELFGAGEGAYNVLLADEMPELDAERIYSIASRQDILKFGDVFMELMTPMIVMMVSVSAVVLVIVMYLMMRMMADRSAFGISMMKIFGYTDKEVRRLYLDGNLITVALSAFAGVPLAKLVMDRVYPYLIANAAIGPEMAMPAWIYASVFGLIFASYFVISALLNRKLRRITPAEALKRRE